MEIRFFADTLPDLETQIRKMGFCKEQPTQFYPAGKGQIPPETSAKYKEMADVVRGFFNPLGRKIASIKFVRAMCNCSLKDAKDFVDRWWVAERVQPGQNEPW